MSTELRTRIGYRNETIGYFRFRIVFICRKITFGNIVWHLSFINYLLYAIRTTAGEGGCFFINHKIFIIPTGKKSKYFWFVFLFFSSFSLFFHFYIRSLNAISIRELCLLHPKLLFHINKYLPISHALHTQKPYHEKNGT